jgi:putative membrane protein
MAIDLLLAILHHLLVFSLVAILAVELVLMRPGLGGKQLARLGAYDAAYGAVAGLVLVVGFLRVFFGLKGADYYFHNHFFWGKIGSFIIVGLLSIVPTIRILQWRRESRANPAFAPPEGDVLRMRRYMHGEGLFIVLIIVFAAAMARYAT